MELEEKEVYNKEDLPSNIVLIFEVQLVYLHQNK